MTTWLAIGCLAIVLLLGYSRQLRLVRQAESKVQLANDFLTKFVEWFNNGAQNQAVYNWMLHHSEKMQASLGPAGLVSMRRPFESGYHTNYPVLLNAIPEIQRELGDHLGGNNARTLAQLVDGCLRRYIGSIQELLLHERSRRLNPFAWFAGGVSTLLQLPLQLLSAFHVISDDRSMKVSRSRPFNVLSACVGIAGLLGTVITITLGWAPFQSLVTRWLTR